MPEENTVEGNNLIRYKYEIACLFREKQRLQRLPTDEELVRWRRCIIQTKDEETITLFFEFVGGMCKAYHKNTSRRRHYLNMKYKLLKSLLRRAIKFRDVAETKAGRDAWNDVVIWFNSFLTPEYRVYTKKKGIGVQVDIDKVFRSIDEGDEKEDE